jgi:D-alanyl-lipoteichoic acid acyltransferase DltB (MBOAT superfamily)
MVFSSPQFILLFLPVSFAGYFLLLRFRLVLASKIWLVGVSLFFYGYWNVAYLPLLLASIGLNFLAGVQLARRRSRLLLAAAVAANLATLAYFKYANFLIENINAGFGSDYALGQIILPLGISFYTFTQIAYLVDSYSGSAKEYDPLNYALFVTFFPHLIAGPILHHSEMMPQFRSRWTLAIRYPNIMRGLFIFSIGLFKKVMIADTFAIWADAGFDGKGPLDFYSAWGTSLAYTFQLYFDFSGYCDMAIGAALLFNIWLPINFNSPYKSLDIRDFWRRWHITLSRYLRDYLYIPLGGNRSSTPHTYFNLMATFVLGGLWHGASWMFVIWGALHGAALVAHRIWRNAGFNLPKPLAWLLTFLFVNVTWVFFRAKSMDDAMRILRGLVSLEPAALPTAKLAWGGWLSDIMLRLLPAGIAANLLCWMTIGIAFVLIAQRNSTELTLSKMDAKRVVGAALIFCISVYAAMVTKSTVFLYFEF